MCLSGKSAALLHGPTNEIADELKKTYWKRCFKW
jgi:hypothetical protein